MGGDQGAASPAPLPPAPLAWLQPVPGGNRTPARAVVSVEVQRVSLSLL